MVCVIEWKWNGPSEFLVFQIATPVTSASATVAPRCPKRRPAQIKPGKARYSSAFGEEKASAVSTPVVASIKTSSAARARESRLRGRDHARASGTTTRAPQASPSHHVRHTAQNASGLTTPPTRDASVPTVALTIVASATGGKRRTTPSPRASKYSARDARRRR